MAIARFRAFLSKANGFHGVGNIFSYSVMTETRGRREAYDEAMRLLYKRISPIGDPAVPMAPVLDQWVREGNEVNKFHLSSIIKKLISYKRYFHALQISMWMSDKMHVNLNPRDISVRLDLISKVHSLEAAESYFDTVPFHLRSLEVYGALLKCYANAKCIKQAESLMHKLRDLGLARGSLVYSFLLGLYQRTGNYEKMESLIQEMGEKQIRFGSSTYIILINACAAKSDISSIEKILKMAESDDACGIDWRIYSNAAQGYMEAGLVDKAATTLRNAEIFIANSERDYLGYEFLLTQYAKAGCRDDVLRVWEIYNKRKRVLNKGYLSCISSLLTLDDIETAEKVFEEWKPKALYFDARIPNLLIAHYCKKGLLEKAKAITEDMISKGANLNGKSWYYISSCHLQDGRSQEAVEAMKESLKVAKVIDIFKWPEYKDVLEACLTFLIETGNIETAEEFVRLLEQKSNLSSDACDSLLQCIRGKTQNTNVSGGSDGESEEQ